ncbi:MAG TPA: asparagine synthase-related protein [Terriglobales bacterium]|jgi:asparagine synthase (glutamine-hydrolysing)|nr:asparagine synthase-related protein [Terriglobales bacterium]
MSGIAGLWRLDGRPVNREEIARLSQAIAHRGPDGEQLYTEGSVGLAFQCLQVRRDGIRQPYVAPSRAVIVFDGRVDNRSELLELLAVPPDTSDAPLALAAYERFGEDFAGYLNGDFALAIFDYAQRKLLLARDVLGMRPLYYCALPGLFLFASEIKAILAHPDVQPRPNDDALADLLLAGNAQCRHLTPFDGVLRLLPGHLAVATSEGLTSRQYWDFDPARRIRYKCFQDYVEQLRFLFQQAVARRLRCSFPVAVSVSGGLDSSGILCTAKSFEASGASTAPAMGVSLNYPDGHPADEKQFLLEIERHCGISIHRVPARQGYLAHAREAVWHTETPVLHPQWNSQRELFAVMRQLGARQVLAGMFGDQMLSDTAYLFDLVQHFQWVKVLRISSVLAERREGDPRYLRRKLCRDLLRSAVPSALLHAWRAIRFRRDTDRYPLWYSSALRRRALARAQIQKPLSWPGASKHSLGCYHHSRAHLNIIEEQNKAAALFGLELAYPFLDRDLIAFIMAIPGEVVNWQGVPKGLYRAAMKGLLPEAIRLRDTKADFTHFVNEGSAREYGDLQEYVAPGCLSSHYGYVDVEVAAAELVRERSGLLQGYDGDPTRRLARLVGLELWLRLFFGEKQLGSPQNPPSSPAAEMLAPVSA